MAALPFTTLRSMNKTTVCLQGTNRSSDIRGNKAKFLPAVAAHNTNTAFGISSPTEIMKSKLEIASPPAPQRETIIKQLDRMIDPPTEILLENGLVFQQNFTVRSFEIGSDSKISLGTLMNYLQETALNHHTRVGVVADGFGSTAKMCARNLTWVICWSQIEVCDYPSWADVVQVDTWKYRSGKNGLGCDWHVRDFQTGKTLIQATSFYVMMNKKTRKFAKFSDEFAEDIHPYLKDCNPLLQKDNRRLVQIDTDKADNVRAGLMPGWTDIDVNQHVSHIKLINYVLESVPHTIVKSHELSVITLEYRNECNGDRVLQSLSRVISKNDSNHLMDNVNNDPIEFDHLLRLECGQEIVRGRTTWKSKYQKLSTNEFHT